MSEKIIQKLGRIREAMGVLQGLRDGCREKMAGALLNQLQDVELFVREVEKSTSAEK